MDRRDRFLGPPDPAIVAKYARMRRRTYGGEAALVGAGIPYIAGLSLGWLPYRPPLNGPFLAWVLIEAVGTAAVLNGFRCPQCHRFLYWEARLAGSRTLFCHHCGALLS